ncbi:MAG: PKD domain-containing protein, partial [Candidatus Woesearchaeota archaeon]
MKMFQFSKISGKRSGGKAAGLAVLIIAFTAMMALAVSSASVYITPDNPSTTDDLICHAQGGCYDLHIVRWYRNDDFYGEMTTTGAYTVPSTATSGGDNWQCKAFDYCSENPQNPLGQDSVDVQIANNPPQISPNIPDVHLLQDSGFNDNVTDLWQYVNDESANHELSYDIVEETDTSVVDCSIDQNRYVDCDVQPDMTGYSDVRVRITDPQGAWSEDVFRVFVDPVNQHPVVNLVSPQSGEQFALCENVTFLVNATDTDGSIQDIIWTIDGSSFSGNNITRPVSDFGIGTHSGSVTVTDNLGGTTTVDVNFEVLEHTNPEVVITSPVYDPVEGEIYQYLEGTLINFSALANATDPCTPPAGFQYIWRDNGIEIASDEQNFSLDNMTLGMHNITVYVTDGLGGEAYDSMIINITETPNQCPEVQIIDPSAGDSFANPCEQIDFTSSVTDADGSINSLSWIYDSSIISSEENFSRSADFFGAGDHTVTLSASDDRGCRENMSVTFNVAEHINPSCTITSPVNDPDPSLYYNYTEGTLLDFNVTATAQDICAPSEFQYIWDDTNTPLYTDDQSFSVDNLTTGEHNMTVYATDGFGGECYDTLLVNITEIPNTPPVADIITPVQNEQFVQECQQIGFTSDIYDPDPEGSINSISWTWDGNELSTDSNFTINASNFPLGNNTVMLHVTDDEGATATDSVRFNIAAHTPPAITIISPPNGTAYPEGSDVNFEAMASPTDACPAEYDWIWRDDLEPTQMISRDRKFTLSNLSAGLHDITAYAYDQFGQSNYSSVQINITEVPNIAPVIDGIRCVNETGGPRIKEWDGIYCNASAHDDDGVITGWLWSVNGDGVSIGPNTSDDTFTLPDGLDDGNYTVSLTVVDNGTPALSATDSIDIEVVPNIAPTVSIDPPAADPHWNMEYCSIDFNATADDPDGYILQPWDEIYTWNAAMANGTTGFITDDQSFTYSDRLPAGMNTFSVTVTDDDGATATDTVRINTTENVPPAVDIMQPASTPTYNVSEGNNITFNAQITGGMWDDCGDCTADDYSWGWFDEHEGSNTQVSGSKSFTMEDPSVGIHRMTVITTDCYGDSSMDTIVVNVTEIPNNNPVVTIHDPVEPATDYYIDHCEDVMFNATAVDPDGDDIDAWLWNFETRDGMQSMNLPVFSVPAVNFTIGNHTAYAYAFDNQSPSGVGSDSRTFEVVEHTDPDATIDTPSNGSMHLLGAPLEFSATATPTDRCDADTFSWIWTDDGDTISDEQSFNTSSLSRGWHRITVHATDQFGHSGSDTIYINITENVNQPPVINSITCLNMSNSSTIYEFEDFYCYADASDPDGEIVSWVWDIEGDGEPSQSASDVFNPPVTLENGTYNVSLTVVDNGTTTDPLSATETVPVEILNNAPEVTLTSEPDPAQGPEPLFMNFTCSVTPGTGNEPYRYNMSFGEGSTDVVPMGDTTSAGFTLTYDQNGTYNATCYVRDNDGDTGADSIIVTVDDTPINANFTYEPQAPVENDTISFTDTSESYDQITSWEWDFDNDGVADATTQNASHRFLQDGTYPVTLTVEDINGETDSMTRDITVLDTEPTASITAPDSIVEGQNATIVGFGEAYDSPVSYSWDFGDGTTRTGQVMGHVYGQQGDYTITLTVEDSDGSQTTATHAIQVNDTAPEA